MLEAAWETARRVRTRQVSAVEITREALDRVEALGLVMQTPDAVRLSERGYLLSNQVFMRLLPEEA